MNTSNVIGQCYTGPYISDGEFQTSVKFGKSTPVDRLDALSRYHDSAYANWFDLEHRAAADYIYYRDAHRLPGFVPRVAAYAVLYGNVYARALVNPVSSLPSLTSPRWEIVDEVEEFYLGDPVLSYLDRLEQMGLNAVTETNATSFRPTNIGLGEVQAGGASNLTPAVRGSRTSLVDEVITGLGHAALGVKDALFRREAPKSLPGSNQAVVGTLDKEGYFVEDKSSLNTTDLPTPAEAGPRQVVDSGECCVGCYQPSLGHVGGGTAQFHPLRRGKWRLRRKRRKRRLSARLGGLYPLTN